MKDWMWATLCVLFVSFIATVAVASPSFRVLPENSSGMWTVVSAVSDDGSTITLHLEDIDNDSRFGICQVPAKPFVQAGYFPQPGDMIGEDDFGIDYFGTGRGGRIHVKERAAHQVHIYGWLYP